MPQPACEIVNDRHQKGPFRAVMFDFDGTLSLLRRNWQDIMIPMMADILATAPRAEPRSELLQCVEEFVMRLNGRQTIYQMMQLCDELRKRGAEPLDPLAYKHQYHALLWQEVERRIDDVKSGRVLASQLMVPDSLSLLSALTAAGLQLFLASGTDLSYVRGEVAVLGLDEFFGRHVYGALDDYKNFSKAQVLQQVIVDEGIPGEQIVGFGDGFVEIEEVRKVGGLAIGVASNEETRSGCNLWKRERLIRAGADIIIGDYRDTESLMNLIQPTSL